MPLVHDAAFLEKATAFLIHSRRNGIGEMGKFRFRVAWSWMTDVIDMDHPAVAHAPEGTVDDVGKIFTLLIGTVVEIMARIGPCRHKCAGFTGDDAVVRKQAVVEQIADSGLFRAITLEFLQFAHFVYLADKLDKEQQAYAGNAPYDQCKGVHRYSLVFTRNGVERGG